MKFELTNSQYRVWCLEKIYKGFPVNIIGGYKIINGNIDKTLLEKALKKIVKENNCFNLRFIEEGGKVYQYYDLTDEANIKFIDFIDSIDSTIELEKWVKNKMCTCFNMDQKLYDIYIFRLSKNKIGIFVKLHHLIADGWSFSRIDLQLQKYCEKLLAGYELDILDTQDSVNSYNDLISAERKYIISSTFKKNEKFWKQKLNNISEEYLVKNSFAAKGTRKVINISGKRFEKIKTIMNGYSNTELFVAIYALYLFYRKAQTEMIIGMPVFNRFGKKQKSILGMYTNAMVFICNIQKDMCVYEFLKSIKKQLFSYYAHSKFPLNMLDELGNKGAINNLYNVCLNCYNTELTTQIGNYKVENYEVYSGYQTYALQIVVKESKELQEIQLMFDYKNDLYNSQEIDNMINDFLIILDEMTDNPSKRISEVQLKLEDKTFDLRYSINNTMTSRSMENTIYELIENQVKKSPNSIAIRDNENFISYLRLNELSNQVARKYLYNSIDDGEIVGILTDNSIDTIVCMLAILKAGAVYLPIDVHYPVNRINYMLKVCNVKKLFVNNEIYKELDFKGKVINCKKFYEKEVSAQDKNNLNIHVENKGLAYVIFTSGSTGRPKGVQITEKGLVNYIEWAVEKYGIISSDIMPLYSSISFDLTVTSIFMPLVVGGQIVIYRDVEKNPLLRILEENICTIIKVTPSHLKAISHLNYCNLKLHTIIIGGEELKTDLAKEINCIMGNKVKLYNEYGPTEATVGCMIHQYDKETDIGKSVPIGIPINNTKVYVLDEDKKMVEIEKVGELYIEGYGIAKGYLNDIQKTKENFLENPFIQGSYIYKTGDMVRFLSSGLIEYIGRKDNQVKVRGYRIELEEIENVLLQIQGIKEAKAVVEEYNGTRQLCAYIVKNGEISVLSIQKYLHNYLPQYMIPIDYIELEEMPLNINGKINIQKLKDMRKLNPLYVINEHDWGNEEKVDTEVIEVIKKVLNVNNLSMSDNFFYLGGDSIKAIQIVSKLNEIGYVASIRDILVEPILRDIMLNIRKKEFKDSSRRIEKGKLEELPMVNWFKDRNLAEPGRYFQTMVCSCIADVTTEEIKRAIEKVINYHEAFRLNFLENTLIYNEKKRNIEDIVITYNLMGGKEEFNNNIEMIIRNTKFDIQQDCLLKVYIFESEYNERQKVAFLCHHLIVDGVSWRIVLEDFYKALSCIKSNKEIQLYKKTDSLYMWSKVLSEKREEIYLEEKEYWTNIVNQINLKRNGNYYPKEIEKNVGYVEGWGNVEVTKSLLTKANYPFNTKTYELLIIALMLVLEELGDSDQVSLNLEGHGRNVEFDNTKVDRTVGWFTTSYPVTIHLKKESLNQKIKSIKEMLRNVPRGGIGFNIVRYMDNPFTYYEYQQVNFNFLGDMEAFIQNDLFRVETDSIRLVSGDANFMNYLIDINVFLINKNLKIHISYSENLYKKKDMEQFLSLYLQQISKLVDYLLQREKVEFTPSDFELVDLSMEDLDTLFEE